MPILIDGNNLMHRLQGAERSRAAVRRLTLERVRREKMQVTLVFDGPPPKGVPSRESLGSLTVLYTGAATADDRIVSSLGASGRGWVVVTDDGGLAARARAVGAEVRSIATWMDRRRPAASGPRRTVAEPRLSSHDLADWEDWFASGQVDDD